MDFLNRFGLLRATDARSRKQPASAQGFAAEELMPDADDEPDERQPSSLLKRGPSQDFKKMPCPMARKHSLLTQTLHSSESDSHVDDEYSEALFSGSNRAHSTASTWSRGGSEAGHISDAYPSSTRSGTPSPILRPASLVGLTHMFNHRPFDSRSSSKAAPESIDPLRPAPLAPLNEDAVEKGLGRKRCIMFACKGKADETTRQDTPKPEPTLPAPQPAVPAKRPCTLKFVCPAKAGATPTDRDKPRSRNLSPPPSRPMPRSPRVVRAHRGSDSTVRNESPKSVRKVPSASRNRRSSSATGVPICEATRFHEFASSEEECEDWTEEKCIYRTRLTVEDTLKVENNLRKLGEEAEDEELEEEEAEEQLAAMDDDEDDVDEDEDDDDDDNQSLVDSAGYVTDDGFHTDDENGFAESDDDSDAGSDYQWWAPGHNAKEAVEHIRPLGEVIGSPSSIGSFSSTRVFPSKTPKALLKKSKANPIDVRPHSPELPDSTDFVCGTLDEDKPLEDAWRYCREQRRAAKHKVCAQDIDPTFPASDPDMDEEDEAEEYDLSHMDLDDSDRQFLIHGHPAAICEQDEEDERQPHRVVPRKRSPVHSPKRLRSPPPAARPRLHSPTPRRLFGVHSPKRSRSPAPRRLRSPPPTRRTSFLHAASPSGTATPIALAQRPCTGGRTASSVPRHGPYMPRPSYFHSDDDDDDNNDNNKDNDNDGDETQTDLRPARGAIDIVKGLERKRQRRREKLLEKHSRQKARSKKHANDDVVLPGVGAQKMRRVGEGLVKLRGHGFKGARAWEAAAEEGQHILSY